MAWQLDGAAAAGPYCWGCQGAHHDAIVRLPLRTPVSSPLELTPYSGLDDAGEFLGCGFGAEAQGRVM